MKKICILVSLCLCLFASSVEGKHATSFTLPNLYNADLKTSLQEYKGKVVLLNLWASWCGGCQEEMPLFVALQKEFSHGEFYVVLSSIDKDPQNAIAFLQSIDKKKVLTALYDEAKSLPKAYKCIGMPSSYLIDKNGKIVKEYVGSMNDDDISALKNTIQSLLK